MKRKDLEVGAELLCHYRWGNYRATILAIEPHEMRETRHGGRWHREPTQVPRGNGVLVALYDVPGEPSKNRRYVVQLAQLKGSWTEYMKQMEQRTAEAERITAEDVATRERTLGVIARASAAGLKYINLSARGPAYLTLPADELARLLDVVQELWPATWPADPFYAEYPDHPLHRVPQRVLDAGREITREAAETHDVETEHADAIADGVVAATLPLIRTWLSPTTRKD